MELLYSGFIFIHGWIHSFNVLYYKVYEAVDGRNMNRSTEQRPTTNLCMIIQYGEITYVYQHNADIGVSFKQYNKHYYE